MPGPSSFFSREKKKAKKSEEGKPENKKLWLRCRLGWIEVNQRSVSRRVGRSRGNGRVWSCRCAGMRGIARQWR